MGKWLDRLDNVSSDYLKITGTVKRQQKFHVMKLFCGVRKIRPDVFNCQVLFATSGAANCGIDNNQIYGVFGLEVPPSCEDMVQEEGRAGRHSDDSATTG